MKQYRYYYVFVGVQDDENKVMEVVDLVGRRPKVQIPEAFGLGYEPGTVTYGFEFRTASAAREAADRVLQEIGRLGRRHALGVLVVGPKRESLEDRSFSAAPQATEIEEEEYSESEEEEQEDEDAAVDLEALGIRGRFPSERQAAQEAVFESAQDQSAPPGAGTLLQTLQSVDPAAEIVSYQPIIVVVHGRYHPVVGGSPAAPLLGAEIPEGAIVGV